MTKSSSRALSRVNLTGFTMPASGKNRKYVSILKNSLKTSLKTGFAQISLAAQKSGLPKVLRGLHPSPPRPTDPYAYGVTEL